MADVENLLIGRNDETALCLRCTHGSTRDCSSARLDFVCGHFGRRHITQTRSGKFYGCSLNYRAAVQDHIYGQGNLALVAGSFSLNLLEQGGERTVGIMFKIGVKPFTSADGPTVAPSFAYMKGKNGTTANALLNDAASDTPGFRLFILRFDNGVSGLVGDLLDGGPVSIFYNLSKGGIDVAVPLDLSVSGAKASNDGIERLHSPQAVNDFRDCFNKLVEAVK